MNAKIAELGLGAYFGQVYHRFRPEADHALRSNLISEAWLYALIFGCRLQSAKRFKPRVAHEVLPALRKTSTSD